LVSIPIQMITKMPNQSIKTAPAGLGRRKLCGATYSQR
jgi:hypothetical protein